MTKQQSTLLRAALRRRQLVRFTRPFKKGFVDGYVHAVGPKWFLLALVNDDVRFDGFRCFRLQDVRKLQMPHPRTQFIEAALKKRGERQPKMPRVRVARLEDLLRSANRRFPLVSIHRERVEPGCCWIGRVHHVGNRQLVLHEITPDAVWDRTPRTHRLAEITRVDFGGDYEDALHVVGGDPAEDA